MAKPKPPRITACVQYQARGCCYCRRRRRTTRATHPTRIADTQDRELLVRSSGGSCAPTCRALGGCCCMLRLLEAQQLFVVHARQRGSCRCLRPHRCVAATAAAPICCISATHHGHESKPTPRCGRLLRLRRLRGRQATGCCASAAERTGSSCCCCCCSCACCILGAAAGPWQSRELLVEDTEAIHARGCCRLAQGCVWIAGRGAEACTGRRQGATNSNAPLLLSGK
mmetsp:Transcript_4042/g.10912  ORF Transcript_4042/g.10912 Transcript_4042/m.10912 type:complete len:227 (-) Transcript_4042:955-1635(-)